MNDWDSVSRENQKRQLRRQIVRDEPAPWGEDSEDVVRRAHGRAVRRRTLIALLVFLLIAAAGAGWLVYQRYYQYTSFETVWETAMNEGSLVGYESFGTGLLKYTKDGATYIDGRGRTVWTESYEMKSPFLAIQGDYAAIADRQGNTILICGLDGKLGEANALLPVGRAAVAANGIVAAVLEDSVSSYITFYQRDGTALDITIKTMMAGDGYPLDLALSADGTQLMCSFVYITNGEVKSRVVFYDFSEVGKNVPNRLVGGFDEPFESTLVPRVIYMDDAASCAFSGRGPVFFSSENLASPKLVAQVETEEVIETVACSGEYAAVIVRTVGGEYENRLDVYKKDGTPVMSREFTYEYVGADIDDDLIILYNEDSCRIFNMAGVEKLYAAFSFPVSKIRKGRYPDTLLVAGPQQIRQIRLH